VPAGREAPAFDHGHLVRHGIRGLIQHVRDCGMAESPYS
jgi:hypothetical protein